VNYSDRKKNYAIAEIVLSYPIAYTTRFLQMLMDGKETPPSFFERVASNPAGCLGKGFLNYKRKKMWFAWKVALSRV